MFRTAAGKVRRLDLIFVPKPEFAFGYLGWVRLPYLLLRMCPPCKQLETCKQACASASCAHGSRSLSKFVVCRQVGSRQFLRFLRQHAANRNMHLNSHRRASAAPDCRHRLLSAAICSCARQVLLQCTPECLATLLLRLIAWLLELHMSTLRTVAVMR